MVFYPFTLRFKYKYHAASPLCLKINFKKINFQNFRKYCALIIQTWITNKKKRNVVEYNWPTSFLKLGSEIHSK